MADRNSKFTQHRLAIPGGGQHQIEGNTVRGVVIATDKPVTRSWGEERFVISEESIDLEEFRSIGLNLLDSHDPSLRRMGTVSNPVFDGNKVRADITFDTKYEKSREIFEAIRDDNQRQDLSVGYVRLKVSSELMGESDDTWTDTVEKLRIIEVSVVGMGADTGAGFGRQNTIIKESSTETISEPAMTKDNEATKVNQAEETRAVASSPAPEPAPAPKKADLKAVRAEAGKIMTMARNNDISDETVQGWFSEGINYNECCARVMEAKQERGKKDVTPTRFADNIPESAKGSIPAGDNGRQLRLIDAVGAMAAQASGDKLTRAQEFATEVSKSLGGTAKRFRVPFTAVGSRTFTAQGGNNTGDNLITDEINMGMLKEFLYKETVTGKLGLEMRTGLVNDLSVPRIKSTTTANWVKENTSIGSSDVTTETFSLTPHTLASRSSITNLSRVQNPMAQSIITSDLLRTMAIKIDETILKGDAADNSATPKGIQTSGVPSADRPGNAAAKRLTDLNDFSWVIQQIRKAEISEVPSFVVNDDVLNKLRTIREGNNGPYLWTENRDASTVQDMPGRVFGSPIYRSSNLGDAAATSVIIGGVWRHMLQCIWGNSFLLTMGESDQDFENDRVSMRLVSYMDFGVSYPKAFAIRTAVDAS